MKKMKKNSKEVIIASGLTLLMAFMDISGLPSTLFLNIRVLDIEPFYFTLMFNFLIIGVIFYLFLKGFLSEWPINLKKQGIRAGLKKYGPAGMIALALSFTAFYIGLQPFDNSPTFWKVLVEGFIYYIGVGIIEELYVRGLLLNIIEKLFYRSSNAVFWAVILSSLIFGLGHVFGALENPPLTIIAKITWTIGLGVYLGAVYKKSGNLWVPILLHIVMDFCGVPFCFSTSSLYPDISLFIILPVYLLLGVYGVYILCFQKAKG